MSLLYKEKQQRVPTILGKKLELNSISLTRELAFYRVLQTFLVIQYQGESFVMP